MSEATEMGTEGRRLAERGVRGAAALVLALALAQAGARCGGDGGGGSSDGGGVELPPPLPPPAGARGCEGLAVSPGVTDVTLELVAGDLGRALLALAPPGDTERLFVVEQNGLVRILRDGALLPTPFVDLSERISTGGERGLLGLAFHPDFETNGRLFASYTNPDGDTRVVELALVDGDPDRAAPSSERVLLALEQPFSNHNGGHIVFGPDGYLYIGLGDGGSGGDPLGNAQDLGRLLGSILRIDVDGEAPYSIPADNPFVGTAGARGEIWAYGLRNPWRFSFDRANGNLWIGDVGQGLREEVSVGLASTGGGENYGWNPFEADQCFTTAEECDALADAVPPVVAYGHDEGCSITGGVVYRGRSLPALQGTYFYADFCSALVRSFRPDERGRVREERDLSEAFRAAGLVRPSSFGEDGCGEAYVVDIQGRLYRIAPAG